MVEDIHHQKDIHHQQDNHQQQDIHQQQDSHYQLLGMVHLAEKIQAVVELK